MFIAMDPPKHDEQRKVVQPIVAPGNLTRLQETIRARVGHILDGLPRDETFNWVDRVSIELTTSMLATLFDFPFEDRRKLTFWSDCATMDIRAGGYIDFGGEARGGVPRMPRLFREAVERAGELAGRRSDLDAGAWRGDAEHVAARISRQPDPADRRRQRHDAELDQRRTVVPQQEPQRVPQAARQSGPGAAAVPETIRYQTPLAHMRRIALADVEVSGKTIQGRPGGDVVHFGQPRREMIDRPNEFIIDRERPRQHISFGFGVHRCVGNRSPRCSSR